MKVYGLIGYPLGHSFSKKYFTEKFRAEGLNARFESFEIPDIKEFLPLIETEQPSGLSVTIPYKSAVIQFLHELDRHASAIGAVNCIRFSGDRMIGYNTDCIGFEQSLLPLLTGYHKQALIL